MTINAARPVVIMAGGTGGHVYPALAVARELQSRGVEVVWVGTHTGLESRVIPEAGIPIEWISASGLRGKTISRWIKAPFMLALTAYQAMRILLRRKPRAVLGMGGFVSGPGGLVARLLGKPLCIHEQNSIAGMTNRWLSRIASCVMEAFPGSLPARSNAVLTGNPVREDIALLPNPESRFQGRTGNLHLLVLGGSLGAQALNEVVPAAVAMLDEQERPQVRHQAGPRNIEHARDVYQQAGIKAEVMPFIEDMAGMYAWADLVVCRAGALTIAELTAAGIASVLVPYPYAVDDHQTFNARYLVDHDAGILIQQNELSAEKLASLLREFTSNRDRLLQMARAARALARPDATRKVADLCLQAAGGEA